MEEFMNWFIDNKGLIEVAFWSLVSIAGCQDLVRGFISNKITPYQSYLVILFNGINDILQVGQNAGGKVTKKIDPGNGKMVAKVGIVLLICIPLFIGCSGFQISKDPNSDNILKNVAISVASKALGERLADADKIEWTPVYEKFYLYIQENGISVDSATIVGNYLSEGVTELYKEEADTLALMVGFKVSAEGYDPDGANFDSIMIAISGFRKGVFSKKPWIINH